MSLFLVGLARQVQPFTAEYLGFMGSQSSHSGERRFEQNRPTLKLAATFTRNVLGGGALIQKSPPSVALAGLGKLGGHPEDVLPFKAGL